MEAIKKISVSKLLNLYFPGIDIFSYPVQKGIFRGVAIDWALEDYFKTDELNLRPVSKILSRINNDQVKNEANEVYEESKKCLDGVKKFLNEHDVKISDVQVHPNNDKFPIHGYIDALMLMDNQKYVVDWKTKGQFKEYNYKNINEDEYENHCKWFNEHNLVPKKFDQWQILEKKKNKEYSLGHLRYSLQVCLYWMILGKPEDTKPAVVYFDNSGNYHIYTFDFENILKICKTLIKYRDSNDAIKEHVSIKLAAEDWVKYINWRKIN